MDINVRIPLPIPHGWFGLCWSKDLKVGEVSNIVKTVNGIHIIKCDNIIPGYTRRFKLVKSEIKEILSSKSELELLSSKLVKEGILESTPSPNNPYIFMHGQSNLLRDEIVLKDLDHIRDLFDEIENKNTFIDILDSAGKAEGVQIFIGSKNFLFKHSGLSMVMAPYKNKEQEIIGAIGVVGPTRLNYAKIVPLVDYTSKIIGKVID